MSVFVALGNSIRIGQHFRPSMESDWQLRRLNSKLGVEVIPTNVPQPFAELLGGAKAGEIVPKLLPQQRGIVRMGRIAPPKYQVLICCNPALLELATVQHPTIAEPKEDTELVLVIDAKREVDLSKFDWLLRAYLTE